MKDPFASSLPDKSEYLYSIGHSLIKTHGKMKSYSPEQIEDAHRNSKWYKDDDAMEFAEFGLEVAIDYNEDISHWAMSVFSSHQVFDQYMEKIGKAYNYVAMRAEMLEGLSFSNQISAIDISTVDVSGINLDISGIEDGEIISGFFEWMGELLG